MHIQDKSIGDELLLFFLISYKRWVHGVCEVLFYNILLDCLNSHAGVWSQTIIIIIIFCLFYAWTQS